MPDFLTRSREHQNSLGDAGTLRLLNSGRRWDLANVIAGGGAIVFPHATLEVCGHQIAAAVHACLDSGKSRVVALGVLHALTPELAAARQRVAEGGDLSAEPTWSIQGPGIEQWTDWQREFSLVHFQYLWSREIERRGMLHPPELLMRYPLHAAGQPALLPGYEALAEYASSAAVVATIDPCHHGIGYGDSPDEALPPEAGGLAYARENIEQGMRMLCKRNYPAYIEHCIKSRSDGRDVGQVLASLRTFRRFEVLDLIADDMTGPYQSPPPTWVAGALITLINRE